MCIRKPTEQAVREYIWQRQEQPFSYELVGGTSEFPTREALSSDERFKSYDIDAKKVPLGYGYEVFQKGILALKGWKHFELDWITLLFPETPIEEGSVVAVLSWQVGFWVLSFCKIVYVINETDEKAQTWKYGFAYGTLEQHLEKGEERFVIEWDRVTNAVSYEKLSFSTPQHWMSQVGYPVSRYFQGKFGEESCAAIQRAIGSHSAAVL
eukprot:TRINITY_DN2545_c0_g2_i2.p1 TRINITY_DN2545_c0_g2~~TRINITY_DN2545_c0_g2_i2.p1  ORF type:complete len:228 (+),score=34.19 TRINITY_DN2545_c0_g2_i2:55-684(+)